MSVSADLILKNATVIAMDSDIEEVKKKTSIAVKDGNIMSVGSESEIMALEANNTKLLDLDGYVVLPGFVDSHVHLIMTGLQSSEVNLRDCRSIDDILDKLEIQSKKESGWVIGRGFDDSKLADKRFPNKSDLDKVLPEQPVYLQRIDNNLTVLNTAALNEVEIDKDTRGLDIASDGTMSGIMTADAHYYIRKQVFDLIPTERKVQAIKEACKNAACKGITTVHAIEYPWDIERVRALVDDLPINVQFYCRSPVIKDAVSLGLKGAAGDVNLDGSLGAYTAALSKPYHDKPDQKGLLYLTQEEVNQIVLEANKENCQIALHAIGDRAIEQVINAFEAGLEQVPNKNHRHRIEHYSLPNQDQIKRTAQLGIYLSMSPAFEYHFGWDQMYGNRLGPERVRNMHPFRDIIDEGIIVAANSDSPVTPMNPLVNLQSAVARPCEDQRISVYEALKMLTINGALIGFEEQQRGSIREGKKADFVVLDNNPFEAQLDKIIDMKIKYTISNGNIVYSS